MKTVKKLLCMLLAIMLMLSSVAAFGAGEAETEAANGAFSDVSDDQLYSDAVSTLNLMGIINGYPGGTFGPEKNVTRAEFTAMLMRTLNLGKVGSATAADLPFTDVDDNDTSINWAIPNINTAYGMKIINGYEDLTFRPSANVAYEEAVKMIVCTLGYGDNVDTSLNPWYANYIAIANQIGITDNAAQLGRVETPASRACIAQLLFDSLEVKLVKNGEKTDETILKDNLGYTKNTGMISSNGITSLEKPDIRLRDNEIQIRTEKGNSVYYDTYRTSDETLKDYFGHEVDFYYVEDEAGVRTIIFCVPRPNDVTVVNAANIELRDTTDNSVVYYENRGDNKAKKISVADDSITIYNGKLYGRNEESSRFDKASIPSFGELKFTDADDDGYYDVVEITAYEVFYVSSKDNAKSAIVDKVIAPAEKSPLSLNTVTDRNLYIVDENGKTVNFSSIATGNIICYAQSSDSNGGEVIKTAVVLNNKVTGNVTAINGDGSITIAGKNYFESSMAPWVSGRGTLERPQIQDSGTFYFDLNGDLVAYTKNATSENLKYGYILGYYEQADSFDSNVEFRVYTSTGSTEYLSTYRNTTVDGETCSTGDEVIEALKATATNPGANTGRLSVQQLVKYTTRTSDGVQVFDKIITASKVSSGADIVSDKLTTLESMYKEDGSPKNMKYNSSSKILVGEGGEKISIGSAVIITAPAAGERGEYSQYKKASVTSTFKNGVGYDVEIFDVSKSNAPKIVVVYGVNNSEAVNPSSPVYLIAGVEQATKDGEVMSRVNAYTSDKPSATSASAVWVSDSSTARNDLEAGDIYRTGLDEDGDFKFDSEFIIYDYEGENDFGTTIMYTDTETRATMTRAGNDIDDISDEESVVIIAKVVALDETTLSIASDEDSIDDITKARLFNISEFEDALVLSYDDEGQELELIVGEYEETIAALASYVDGVDPSNVLIYMVDGEIKLLCVLPQEF